MPTEARNEPARGVINMPPAGGCLAAEADQWISLAGTPKGSDGRLRVAPPGAGFGYVTVYRSGETRKLRDGEIGKVLDLSPGKYDVVLGGVRIANVPLAAGCETRIRAGVLSINIRGSWSVHDETGKQLQNGASEAKRLAFPVGRYQVRASGKERPIDIRDHQTTQF